MTAPSPAFGQADLSNCEREMIHLAGSVQPHGVLLALDDADRVVRLASANLPALFGGGSVEAWLGQPLARLDAGLDAVVAGARPDDDGAEPLPLACTLRAGTPQARPVEALLHRAPGAPRTLLLELEPLDASLAPVVPLGLPPAQLQAQVRAAVERFADCATIGALGDAVVKAVRELVGYDRVMVYKFDPDGHGQVIAEARDPRLDSLLGHHYPASDIPQRARELYLRTRLRVLVDVHYAPAPLVPPRLPGAADELDMSLCHLRSMSPLHLQYLKNMGVTATLVVSLVREGRLWGLIACHHYAPRNLGFALRAAADLLAEAASTRIAAIEHYTHAQVAIQVRRLEQRLVEATSTEGDWRLPLFRNPRTLLQPLEATGAALFHDGEVLTVGEVPSTPQLRALAQWIDAQLADGEPFACSSVARANPALDALTPMASGVVAVRLAAGRPEMLLWLRKEQLLSVTWAGDPTKPVIGDDPLELSPRRSFAAWSEIVRGTATPWSPADLAIARAFGSALVDISVQVGAVRMLIAEDQLRAIRDGLAHAKEAVLVVDTARRVLFANAAFAALGGGDAEALVAGSDPTRLFDDPPAAHALLDALLRDRQPWRGELALRLAGGGVRPVAVRAEVVPGRDGAALGGFLVLADLSETRRAGDARRRLERTLADAGAPTARGAQAPDALVGAILANASLAAMDIADTGATAQVAPLLQELEASTRRATALYERLRRLNPAS
jgi:light-regulated signal transduction histidine kinase (bacteriophytochrome)